MKPLYTTCCILSLLIIFIFSACHRRTIPSASNSNTTVVVKPPVNNSQEEIATMKQDILFYVNKHRRQVGLPALEMTAAATSEAEKHSTNMAAKRVAFGHTGFETRVAAIARALGTVSAAAENVADGMLTAQQVVDGWLHSAGHKKKLKMQIRSKRNLPS